MDSDLDGEALDEHDLSFIDPLGDDVAVDGSAVHGLSATVHGLSALVDASIVDAEAASAVHEGSPSVHGHSTTVVTSIVDATSGMTVLLPVSLSWAQLLRSILMILGVFLNQLAATPMTPKLRSLWHALLSHWLALSGSTCALLA